MSSDSSSISDNSITGHHETWEMHEEFERKKEMNDLREELQRQKWKNAHLEWHCTVYQHTLGKLHGGMQEHERSLAELRTRDQPVCPHCKMEELLQKIADLEEKLSDRDRADMPNKS